MTSTCFTATPLRRTRKMSLSPATLTTKSYLQSPGPRKPHAALAVLPVSLCQLPRGTLLRRDATLTSADYCLGHEHL